MFLAGFDTSYRSENPDEEAKHRLFDMRMPKSFYFDPHKPSGTGVGRWTKRSEIKEKNRSEKKPKAKSERWRGRLGWELW